MAELLLRLSLPLSLIKNTFFPHRPRIKFLAFEMFFCVITLCLIRHCVKTNLELDSNPVLCGIIPTAVNRLQVRYLLLSVVSLPF